MGSEFAPGDLIDCVDQCPLLADFVAEVGDDRRVAGGTTFLIGRLLPSKGWSDPAATELYAPCAKQASVTGGGRTTSFASLRRFCAIAASVNSNCAPRGPRRRRRPSRKMRLRWANSISTRLRSRRERSNASVLASARATPRTSS